MIYIKEDIPQRVTGITSLFISADRFIPGLMEIFKQYPVWEYHKKAQMWEVPVFYFGSIIDTLRNFDTLDIKLYSASTENATEELKPTLEYKLKPFGYQLDGIKYGINHPKFMLLDVMGLGKSCQIIHIAEELKAQKGIKHCLIICGINSLKTNWKKEIYKHSDLSCMIIGEKLKKNGEVSPIPLTIKERTQQLKNKIEEFFVIINIESIRNTALVNAIVKGPNKFDLVVFDEVHKAKDSQTLAGNNLLSITSPYKIAATATPLLNSPEDTYLPLAWIGAEKGTLTNFRKFYCVYGGESGHQIIGYKNLDILHEEIEKFSIRRTKDLLHLPPKNIIKEYLDMDEKQAKFYSDVEAGVKDEVDKVSLNAVNTLALTTRLRQASTCPAVLTTSEIESVKLERCVELIDEIVANGEKVVVFSVFKDPVYTLQQLLVKYNPVIATGDIPEAQFSENVDKFQTDPECKVFIGTIQKAGTGITLTAASYAIFIDSAWTAALEEQAEDRIYRIGTTKPVFIYKLICNNTVDELVDGLIVKKGALEDLVIDNQITEDTYSILKKYISDL